MDTNATINTLGTLLDARYQVVLDSNGEEIAEINLYYRNYHGLRKKQVITNYLPYFYVECSQEKLSKMITRNNDLFSWLVKSEPSEKKTYDDGVVLSLQKLTGKSPWSTPKIREVFHNQNIKTHESDIPFVHRYMIDMDLYGLREFKIENNSIVSLSQSTGIKDLKVLSFDIEIDIDFDQANPSESLSNIMELGSKRITMISCAYGTLMEKSKGGVYSLKIDDDFEESKLISSFWDFVWDKVSPDVIVTYNGDNFDIPYLLKRIEKLGLSANLLSPHKDVLPIKPGYGRGYTIPGVLLYDLFKRTKWLYTDDGRKSLNSVAGVTLGKSKKEIPMSHGEMWRRGLKDQKILEELESYALMDAKLTYELYFGLGLSEWTDVIKITGSPPGEAMYYTQRQAGEFLLYREMFREEILIPPTPGSAGKKERDKDRKSAVGGFVFEPVKSIATGVMIADFSSMYPSLMISHNIGAESFKGIDYSFKERFKSSPKTTMAKMQEKLLTERLLVKSELKSIDEKEFAKKKQLDRYNWALKIVANSTIGSYNYTGSRLYNTNISGSVTGLGRTYLQELASMAKLFHPENETIYGDTDSVFIELPKSAKVEKLWGIPTEKIADLPKLLPEMFELLTYLQNNLPEQMRLDLQDVAYRILFHKGAKKRYSFVSLLTKQIKIIGFEAVRHDWSPFAREIQKKAIETVLLTGDLEDSKLRMIQFLSDKIKIPIELLKKEFITLGPIKRSPKKYKSLTPAMGAFSHFCRLEKLNVEIEWKNYDYFPFLIIQGSTALYNRSKHPKFVANTEIDVNHYLQEALNAINRFNLNISLDEILFEKYDLVEFFTKH